MKEDRRLHELLNKDYMPIIYKNIKKFRIESGLSIIEVADILDMSYDYIRRIESNNDKVKTCSLKLLIKFSILYNKKLGNFLVE
ncbi:MAG: helix-turn-helix transcriptional regulator [Clostridia bacterium]|nr:helix-turn-helix transcriptional regulator [Clostridia bacterium]